MERWVVMEALRGDNGVKRWGEKNELIFFFGTEGCDTKMKKDVRATSHTPKVSCPFVLCLDAGDPHVMQSSTKATKGKPNSTDTLFLFVFAAT